MQATRVLRTAARSIAPLVGFCLKIRQRGDCWEWIGTKNVQEYGVCTWGGWVRDKESELAHRHAYEISKGTIPAHLQIDHICGHPWCVRPSHLEAVLPYINVQRGYDRKGRRKVCAHGHVVEGSNQLFRKGQRSKHADCRQCNTDRANAWYRAHRRVKNPRT